MIKLMRKVGTGVAAVLVAISSICCAIPTVNASSSGGVTLEPLQGSLTSPISGHRDNNIKSLYVAGGCFWCVEAVFEELDGIVDVESGYANSIKPYPTYEEVISGQTRAAEAVKVSFDSSKVSSIDVLKIFLTSHDPTSLNRQGPDSGTQYRSAIFFTNPDEKLLAERAIGEITGAKIWTKKLVTTIEPLNQYSRAEEYHQNYWRKYETATPAQRANMNTGYCNAIIAPKVAKFRAAYRARLRKTQG